MAESTQPFISKEEIRNLYYDKRLSIAEIAKKFNCSQNKVVYWMKKYGIKRRSISEAIYQKHNPSGDPFKLRPITTLSEAELFGKAIGLYWGEGTKSNQYALRLGNTDPELINTFIRFLVELCGVDKYRLRFGLQIFTDIQPQKALDYWTREIGVDPRNFIKLPLQYQGRLEHIVKKANMVY